jgi:acetyl/propionyl-CoA carboxylase alpha subunit
MKLTGRNFLPDAGRLIHTRAPVDIPHRLETGFWEGDEISSYYDPMVCPLLSLVLLRPPHPVFPIGQETK